MRQKVAFGEKLGYSLGDVAANLVFQIMMVFQLKFYTDVFGLEGAVAGTIILIVCLSGAFFDPIVGIITDRTNTRWGKYRPWLLWTALPFSVFYVLAFYHPGIEEKGLVAVYATVSYLLLIIMYAMSSIPYSSLGGVMTSDIKERTSINAIRFVAVSLAQFMVQGLTLPLVDKFAGEEGKVQQGWTLTIDFLGMLGLTDIHQEKTGIWFAILNSFNLIAHDSSDAYSIGFSLFNMVGAVIQLLGIVLLARILANRFGKRNTFIVCLFLTAVFTAMFYLPSPVDISLVFSLCILKSLAYAPTVPLLWAMIGDVADHVEYISKRRATGFCFSGMSFALKAGLGLGGAFAGIILTSFGYVSGLNEPQSAEALQGIRLVSSLIPAFLFGIGVIALLFYPITKTYNEKMQSELSIRRRNISV